MKFKHRLFADTETRSHVDLKTRGAYLYAEDSEPIMWQYALDDGAVVIWEPLAQPKMPVELREYLADPSVELVFHNAEFDRVNMLGWGMDKEFDLNAERFLCTMTWAKMCRLPGGLEELCRVLGVPEAYAKKKGDLLIRTFCVPKNGRFTAPEERPGEWAEFVEYGKFDIVAMRECAKRMPDVFTPRERRLYALTMDMNARGLKVDRELATCALHQSDEIKARYKKEGRALTGVADFNVGSQKAVLAFLADYGVKLDDCRADTLEKFLDSAQAGLIPAHVTGLLATRLKANKASVAKYSAVLKGTGSDGRIRGLINHYAAGTGRDGGRRFQPQNLARPVLLNKKFTMDDAVAVVKGGLAEILFEEPLQLLSDTVRGVLIPEAGRKFCVADLASIEGRILPWVMQEHWMVQYFRDLDSGKVKYDGYQLAYATAFGVEPETVTKEQRTLGKPIDLACLAGETRVVTSNGVKALIEVTTEDRLWDGTCWVEHQGVIQKGVRPTVNADGIWLTADHLVEANGTWTPAGQLVSDCNTLTRALATGSAALRSLVSSGGLQEGCTTCSRSATAGHRSTKSTSTTSSKGRQGSAPDVPRCHLAQPTKNCTSTTLTSSLTQSTEEGCSTDLALLALGATTRTPKTSSHTVEEECACTNPGGRTEGCSLPTPSPSKGGTTLCSTWTGLMSTVITSQGTCASSPEKKTITTDELSKACSDRLASCSNESLNSRPVFDILNAGPLNKFTVLTDSGALVVHNCGFGGGVGALTTFAAVYGIDLDDMARKAHGAADPYLWQECDKSYDWFRSKDLTLGLDRYTWTGCQYIIKAWRNKRQDTVAGWHRLEDAFRNALHNPGTWFEGSYNTHLMNNGGWIFLSLPSKRMLVYPHVHEVERNGRKQLAYMGVNPFTHKWGSIYTYSGKICENIVQAIARDVLFDHLPAVEAAGYPVNMRVHDELITEPLDTPDFSGEHLARMIATPHSWCADLPLNAEGADLTRYQK